MMSNARDEAIELSSRGQQHIEIEDLLKKFNDIQTEFLALQNKIKHNARIQAEHVNLLLDRAHEVSNYYSFQVLTEFSYLYLNYENLKRKLTYYLSESEIKEIENSVIDAAHDDKAFANLMFFPKFQEEHNAAVNSHVEALNQAKQYNEQDVWIRNVNYHERVKSYRTWYVYTGLLSIIGVGIPLLIGGLIAHMIDKISLQLSDRIYAKNNSQIDQQIETRVNPKLPSLQAKVSVDTDNLLRQGFFSLAKQRFAKEMREADDNHNKLPDLAIIPTY